MAVRVGEGAAVGVGVRVGLRDADVAVGEIESDGVGDVAPPQAVKPINRRIKIQIRMKNRFLGIGGDYIKVGTTLRLPLLFDILDLHEH